MTILADRAPSPRSLEPVGVSCDAVREVDPQAVAATYWFDVEPEGPAYSVTIRFVARRIGARGRHGAREELVQYERVDRIIPGSGRVSVTSRFEGVDAGEWEILAGPANDAREPGLPAGWANTKPRRLPRAGTVAETSFAPLLGASAPGVRFGAWPAMVMLGVIAALVMQAWLVSRAGVGVLRVTTVSVIASLFGLAGAKAWYLLLHRKRPASLLETVSAGMCIQGFVVTAVGILALGTTAFGDPLGVVLDATAPGLLVAMAVGRVGCLLAGCCAGRGTRSKFGIWSSDRRIGMRRVPVQLIESALAAALGTVALVADITGPVQPSGALTVATIAAYTALRQLLFPLRAQGRQTPHGRTVTLLASTLATAVAILLIAMHT